MNLPAHTIAMDGSILPLSPGQWHALVIVMAAWRHREQGYGTQAYRTSSTRDYPRWDLGVNVQTMRKLEGLKLVRCGRNDLGLYPIEPEVSLVSVYQAHEYLVRDVEAMLRRW